MTQLTSNRLERLNPTPPDRLQCLCRAEACRGAATAAPYPASPAGLHLRAAGCPCTACDAPAPPKSTPAQSQLHRQSQPYGKQPLLLQPPMEQPRKPGTHAPGRARQGASRRLEAEIEHLAGTRDTQPCAQPLPQGSARPGRLRPDPAEQPTSFFAGTWAAASALLVLMLTIQVVHHYRHDLAPMRRSTGR